MATATAKKPKSSKPVVKSIKLDDLRMDGGTQMRVELNEPTVAEYAEIYESGGSLPPVKVTHDGSSYWLWEGFHRVHARRRAGLTDIPCEVTTGTQREAILLACSANSDHGLKRSNSDKKRAVETLLADKQWGKKSDHWIAETCKVSHPFVAKVRGESVGNISNRTVETKDGKTREVKQKPKAAEPDRSQQVQDFFKKPEPSPLAEPKPVKQWADTFDPAEVEKIETKLDPSIIRDDFDRPIPDRLKTKHAARAQIITWASHVERLKTSLDAFSGQEGAEWLEQHIAPAIDLLSEVRDIVRQTVYAVECPACHGEIKADCKRCCGRGYLPVSLASSLSKAELISLGV